MELYQLEYFLEAARQRNFTRAAARLHLAQAALSEQIRKLESIRSLVAAGLGIAILPRLATRQPTARCVTVRLRGDPVERQVAILSRAGHKSSPSATVFREMLKGGR